jgi:hypothetical protein
MSVVDKRYDGTAKANPRERPEPGSLDLTEQRVSYEELPQARLHQDGSDRGSDAGACCPERVGWLALKYGSRSRTDSSHSRRHQSGRRLHTRDRGHCENGALAQSRTGDPRFRKPGAWDDFRRDSAKNARPLRELYELAARIAIALNRMSWSPAKSLRRVGLVEVAAARPTTR